ncbi:unnamed protein product [Amoebophrya sp. A120]|nr:unnamed protein product [Amoebophrya sp. A120]|eukprot:GSA120T00002266001.1
MLHIDNCKCWWQFLSELLPCDVLLLPRNQKLKHLVLRIFKLLVVVSCLATSTNRMTDTTVQRQDYGCYEKLPKIVHHLYVLLRSSCLAKFVIVFMPGEDLSVHRGSTLVLCLDNVHSPRTSTVQPQLQLPVVYVVGRATQKHIGQCARANLHRVVVSSQTQTKHLEKRSSLCLVLAQDGFSCKTINSAQALPHLFSRLSTLLNNNK